ncbi:MAG: Nop14-like family [Lasallia pustulata]|uniref:Nop14-like family n=1 Tax=Lasallia pustulata TaxID=136370 RepID=A0A5M8Q536_9LECA|nr:MAG: Nop14-like family [Lasallia pustulata]
MPPSQLKRLKSSLREQGIVGPQQSKKQKKQVGKNGASPDKRVQRNAALQEIREQFNPFEVKAPSRGNKYEFTNSKSSNGGVAKGVAGRPGVTKGLGEENRRHTLLVEMQRRKKVGGILDRRFGENDPTMTPDEKAMERFVREKQRGHKKDSLFDLEEGGDEQDLTHFGKSLSFDQRANGDDYNEDDLGVSDEEDHDAEIEHRSRKRPRLSVSQDEEQGSSNGDGLVQPERKKTKQEVMKEVMAKSKLHKYERQQAKEDDDDLRAELDKDLQGILSLLKGSQRQPLALPPPEEGSNRADVGMNPDRAALLNGKDRSQADKEYDERLRQMAFDKRAAPTQRTKTEEERLEEEAHRLKELEDQRLRRMRGEQDSSDDEAIKAGEDLQGDEDGGLQEEEESLGLGAGVPAQGGTKQIDVEDEDDFLIEEDLLASGSDVELSEDERSSAGSTGGQLDDDEDMEFVRGLLSKDDAGREGFVHPMASGEPELTDSTASNLAYTYSYPQTHAELLQITEDMPINSLPTIVQRIRALHHPKLQSDNKAKLGVFSKVLVDHIAFLANKPDHPPFSVLEALIRHIHSLGKSFPEEVGSAFRSHLKSFHEVRPTAPTPGDLIILTAIASIFPTSDHFHEVVTPATLCMARYLSQNIPQHLCDLATGAYFETLCVQYQRISKRYIPELVNYALNALCMLAPAKLVKMPRCFPYHEPRSTLRLGAGSIDECRRLKFWDVIHEEGLDDSRDEELKAALIESQINIVDAMAELWVGKSAFSEIFEPVTAVLRHLFSKGCSSRLSISTKDKIQRTSDKLQRLLHQARLSRRPLLLHNHRPLAIKTSVPKFEESYNPSKHYDPDRERAELSKLKAEHKRERKGALRELRKDANFIARESLRDKKEKDAEYEKKYKRLVAEIQGEEGHEAKAYEREKRMRKAKR